MTKIGVTAAPGAGQAAALTLDGWVPFGAKHPGQELAYVEYTTNVSVTATTEGTANTVVTAPLLAFDGKPVLIEFFGTRYTSGTTNLSLVLYDDPGTGTAASIGILASRLAAGQQMGGVVARRLSPSGYHTYSVRAFVDAGTGGVLAGTGGSTKDMPGFIRITRAAGGA